MADVMDVRTRERNLRRGRISREEVSSHLQALPDAANNADYIDYEKLFEEERRAAEEAEAGQIKEAPPPPPFGAAAPIAPPLASAPVPSPAEGGPAAPIPPLHGTDN